MKIALASDHGGFALKEIIRKALPEMGHDPVDFGTYSSDSVDWPDFIYPAAMSVALGECDRAILIDGVGYSSSMLANMIPGIYAAVCADTFSARMSQEHSNSNVLCLGGKVLGEMNALEIVKTFLSSKYLGGKYQGRVDKLKAIEAKHLRALAEVDGNVLEVAKPANRLEGKCLTAKEVLQAIQAGGKLTLARGATLTPSARETLREAGLDPDTLLQSE